MTFEPRQALTYVSLGIEHGACTYGVAPCTASIPTTGSIKCFNSRATCQDIANFDAETVTLLFAKAADYRPLGLDAIPSIDTVDFTPATLNPGEDLGTRATLRVTFKDHPHSDTGAGFDKYYAERPYDPYQQGTFWPKFRARQPFLRGEPIVWYEGFVGQELSEMDARHFLVESFDGPTPDGYYTLIAHDPLKMLDGDRAQCPVLSQGRLAADIDLDDVSVNLAPTGIGNAEYPLSGYVAIGGTEICAFTRSGDALTLTRSQLGTPPAEHDAQDRVQIVEIYDSMDAADIISDLMQTFAGVPSGYIPLEEWAAETGAFLRRNYTAVIAEPTSVNLLVAELMQQCGLSLWWDDLAENLRLRVLRQISTDANTFTETLYRKGTFTLKEQPNKRVSQVWTFYAQINPLKSIEDRENFRSSVLTVDLPGEANYGASKIKKIYSRWISQGGRTAAERVNDLQIARFSTPPRMFTYSLFRGAQGNPELGVGYKVGHRVLQDATGSLAEVPVQMVRVKPKSDGFEVDSEEFNYVAGGSDDLSNRQITIDSTTYDLNLRTLHDDLYPAPLTGDTITCSIESGVVVGATASTIPAFDVGTWPTLAATGDRSNTSPVISSLSISTALLAVGIRVTGTGIPADTKILTIDGPSQVTLTRDAISTGTGGPLTFALVNVNIINLGAIQGAGAPGGRGANDNGDAGSGGKNGLPGGTGLYCRYLIGYTDTAANTNGGGGGGAGGSCADFNDHRGGGGGGGAGSVPGAGGVGPGNGEEGSPGTATTGGAGGRSYTSSVFWSGPELKSNVRGGDGGDLGQAGDNDVNDYDVPGGSPGAAGKAIDGLSYVTTVGATGTRLGPQVN